MKLFFLFFLPLYGAYKYLLKVPFKKVKIKSSKKAWTHPINPKAQGLDKNKNSKEILLIQVQCFDHQIFVRHLNL